MAYLPAFPSPFSVGFKWQYPFQRMYIEKLANDDTDGFFSAITQASGYYYICFNTDNIEEYRAYTDNSRLSFTMEEYIFQVRDKGVDK